MSQISIGSSKITTVAVGAGAELLLQSGPCVIENRDLCFSIAEKLKTLCERLSIGYVFKVSFDKANRTRLDSFRGPGLDEGLRVLEAVKQEFDVPVVSDIHLPEQAESAGQVLDVIQIPAFLTRQTDLLVAAARTGKVIQVKKAQFMAPWDMSHVVGKLRDSGCERIILVERGSSFGYNRLICDLTAIAEMQALSCPVLLDATHSTQQPSAAGGISGGSAEMGKLLAKAGIAAGADGLFIETHPDPTNALSDAASMIPLADMEALLQTCCNIYQVR